MIKENWNKVDERCYYCNQVTKRQRGITKQNLKRLITPRWDLNEIIVLFMIVMVITMAFSYKSEISACRDWISDMFVGNVTNCIENCDYRCKAIEGIYEKRNTSFYPSNVSFMNELIMNDTNR
jgi:hypothetical protein